MQISQPVVRIGLKGLPIFILLTTKVGMSLSGIENYCRSLKDMLRMYVSYRLQGNDEVTTATKLQQAMKDTDMFDPKNTHRGRKPFAGVSTLAT
jgi:hypothetical protein